MFNFERLNVYADAKEFAKLVFENLKHLKIDIEIERQIKRAAISVMLNIAEGSTRGSKRQLSQFLWISPDQLVKQSLDLI